MGWSAWLSRHIGLKRMVETRAGLTDVFHVASLPRRPAKFNDSMTAGTGGGRGRIQVEHIKTAKAASFWEMETDLR
jgi:hypothetical protein